VAKFDFEIPTEFIKQLGRLEEVDKFAPAMIDAAIPILERNVKSEASKHKDTGELERSIKRTRAKKNQYGFFATVRPTGVDSKGVRNMEKLVYSEYGTSKQSPRPILTKAIKDSERPVLDKMQEVFNQEVEK